MTFNAAQEYRSIPPVTNGPEIARIRALPRNGDLEDVRAIVERPGATMRLRADQAQALSHAKAAGGLLAPLAVGRGKTLLACLLPTVLDRAPAVILTNAGLVRQADEMMREYARHFYVSADIKWLSYGILSSPQQFAVLDQIKPRLIIADECQALANKDSARAKRFNRYLKEHPDTLFCAMSGTITRRSIKDYAHLAQLALGDRTPLPRDWQTLTEWAEAVDVTDKPRPPGALVELMTDEHLGQWLNASDPEGLEAGRSYLRTAARRSLGPESAEGAELQELGRECVRRRLTESVGVVASTENELEAKLKIEAIQAPQDEEVAKTLLGVVDRWERPDGELLTYGLEIARVTKHVRLGGFYRWVWPKSVSPEDKSNWLATRKAWRSDLREFLKRHSKVGLDSPYLVENAVKRGELSFQSYSPWVEARSKIEQPPTEWVWVSKTLVKFAADLVRHQEPLIVWTDTTAVGVEIASLLDCPWYGAGEDAQVGILSERGTRTIVASIKAHGTGRNLQCFSNALVIGCPPSGAIWEQLLGRLHRSGQTSDVVTFYLFNSFFEEFRLACRDAEFVEMTTGNQQKLLHSELVGLT